VASERELDLYLFNIKLKKMEYFTKEGVSPVNKYIK